MCDTLAAVPPATLDGAVFFAKNSDREPGEAQLVEHLPAARYAAGARLRCTTLEIAQAPETHEVLLSRPRWMWGAEMGVNSRGLAIGNEAVFTRESVAAAGLTGMDLLRLALERAGTAREAVDVISALMAQHGQGGACGYRQRNFRYHNSYILADPSEAWVLETAGRYWAAQRVRGIRTISNCLSIGKDFDLLSPDALAEARRRGRCASAADFDFARAFADPAYRALAGGEGRRACTLRALSEHEGKLGRRHFFLALRDHAGLTPEQGWRMNMPCAHASWWPTRHSGQTTASMVSRLSAQGSRHWLTGTSSPCLSVFKPVALGGALLDAGPQPQAGFDAESLFWRHERLHRSVLVDYAARHVVFAGDREAMERRFVDGPAAQASAYWQEHRDAIEAWLSRVEAVLPRRRRAWSPFVLYWRRQAQRDGMVRPRLDLGVQAI